MKNDILFKLLTELVIRQNADFAFVNICNCFNITFVFNLVEHKKTGSYILIQFLTSPSNTPLYDTCQTASFSKKNSYYLLIYQY